MNPFKDVFISYGRKDSLDFATYLQKRLRQMGYGVWFDFTNIPGGVDYQKQIDDAIEKSDNFLFIISPHATASPYCRKELELALSLNKRIIPIMHVEEISRQTWQQRNPSGTDAAWEAYVATGEHSCFTHLHPEIAKINWNQLIFKGGEQIFNEQAFTALLDILQRQNLYVHHHTVLLSQALAWQRHQKQSHHLLIGKARQQAEDWQSIHFLDQQAPCNPTDLHYEFITESIKNAHNMMTQVFIAHAEADRAIAEQVRRSLMRSGITTWIHYSDVEFGSDFQVEMTQGVEEADNVLFLMSPTAFKSALCQQEIDLALEYNKRIIVMLAGAVDEAEIPDPLKNLHRIDLTDNEIDADYLDDESDLLRVLNKEAAYYTEHKVLLTKALKWQRQNQNPCILLQGYELDHAVNWLKVAQSNANHGPTPLQIEFITASDRQPPGIARDVFISYSRSNSGFARKLNDALQRQGKRTWFDQESIASGADFQQEIYKGIEAANHFLFIISPASIQSQYCADEVGYAASLNKRIVTVLHHPVEQTDLAQHPELAKIQWIDFHAYEGEFTAPLQRLLSTLDTDRGHLQAHTRYLQRAIEWDHSGRKESLLLRGDELDQVETWLKQSQAKEPQATKLQQEFVSTSRTVEEANRQATHILQKAVVRAKRLVAGAIVIGGLAAGGAAWFAQKRIAQAQAQVLNAEIQAQALAVENLMASDQNNQALWKALELGQKIRHLPEDEHNHLDAVTQLRATSVLQEVYYLEGFVVRNTLKGHGDWIYGLSFSPDGSTLATASRDSTVKLWDANTGQELQTLQGHGNWVSGVSFSPDGSILATAGGDDQVKLWDVSSGQELQTLQGHGNWFTRVEFSPDGAILATASGDGTVKLWDANTGQEHKTLQGHNDSVWGVSFSPDGMALATASNDGIVKLWDTSSGQQIHAFEGHRVSVNSVRFSPNGTTLATASHDGTVKLWDASSGQQIHIFEGHENVVRSVSFSPDGTTLVTTSDDRTVQLWDVSSRQRLQTLKSHENWVWSASFSSDGTTLASASHDGTVKLWDVHSGQERQTLEGHGGLVNSVSFSPDGSILASAISDGTLKLWDTRSGQERQTVQGHKHWVTSVSFSPDGSTLASVSNNGTVKLWNADDGQARQTLTGHGDSVWSVSFSPDSTLLATASNDSTVKLWDANSGQERQTLAGHGDSVNGVSFSPDGSILASASSDGTVKLWDTHSGQERQTLAGHATLVRSVSFSPDGAILASASSDGTVKLWDTHSGQERQTLTGHENEVSSVSFSPDGAILASASYDATVKLWDTHSGQERQTLRGHKSLVSGITFLPVQTAEEASYVVASASYDGTVKLWDFDLNDLDDLETLMAKACTWQQDYLRYGNATEAQKAICQEFISLAPIVM
ncbi:MAG: TIR domain-containing protein [Leptolyngbya sp. SIO1E4]|nr:TIR domain-containing protein [Leptolyngbya sp. SIO1E4]